MLRATNVDKTVELQCEVVGYQFPDIADDDWCMLRVAIRHGTQSFERLDPALEAHDLMKIHDWFRALAEDRLPRRAHLGFTEPCLGFAFLAKDERGVRFAVHLEAELRPPFALDQFGTTSTEWVVVFHLASDQLASVADAARRAAEQFPLRSCSL